MGSSAIACAGRARDGRGLGDLAGRSASIAITASDDPLLGKAHSPVKSSSPKPTHQPLSPNATHPSEGLYSERLCPVIGGNAVW